LCRLSATPENGIFSTSLPGSGRILGTISGWHTSSHAILTLARPVQQLIRLSPNSLRASRLDNSHDTEMRKLLRVVIQSDAEGALEGLRPLW
jgi:hypothetical protein